MTQPSSSIPHVAKSLQDIADDVGLSAAVILSAWYGGRHLYVPAKIAEEDPLAQLLIAGGAGYASALTLAQLYGGTMLKPFPGLPTYEMVAKMRAAVELRENGLPFPDIGRQLDLDPKTCIRLHSKAIKLGLVRQGANPETPDDLAATMARTGDRLTRYAARLEKKGRSA